MAETSTPAAPGSPAEVGALARVPGALFSPEATFQSIARRPTWVVPILLWIAASMCVAVIMTPKMDFEKMTRERMEKTGQTVPEERMQTILAQQKKFGAIFAYAGSFVAPFLVSLIVAVVFWGAFKAFGWDATFNQAFGATAHAFIPGIVGAILLLPLLARQETVDPRFVSDILRSNLGFLVDRDSSKFLHSLLQSFDLFALWSLFLLVVGFAAAAKVARKQAASLIVTIWFLYVLGKAGLSAVF